jgi:ribokinase
MDKRRFDVVGLGQCCLDVLVTVDAYPGADSKCEYNDRVVQGGGPTGTALVALSRWGLRTAALGVVGDDVFGPMIVRSLDDESVDTAGIVTREGESSQFAFIAAEPGAGSRTVFWRRPSGPPPATEEIDLAVIRRARAFHTDGLFIDAALAGAGAARDAGVPVVVDAGTLRDGMLDLARLSDYFVVAEKFARTLTGGDDPSEACRRLAELGPRVVGVTLGARGAVAMIDGTIHEQRPYPVDAVDTTGCGDVFHAGITFGAVRGWPPAKGLDFAAWAAAGVARGLGGRSTIPTLQDWTGGGNVL